MFKPVSFHLQWHITERCNLHCRHCYQNPEFLKSELESRQLVKILEKFINQIKIWELARKNIRISFTGGEPFLKKDFFDILQKCYENQTLFSYGILTNGVLLNQEIIRRLKDLKVDYIQISLEGMQKTNDSIRGKGVFKKIMGIIGLLKNEGIPINISMTVSKANIADVPMVINLAKRLKIGVGIRRLIPIGKGKEMENLLLSPEEVKELYLKILEMRQNLWDGVGLGCEEGILSQELHYFPKGCSAGYASFTVLPNGDVYPCRRLPIYSGNLLNQGFSDIYYNSKTLQELRNLNNINGACQGCPFFNECHGGAKCISYAYFGSPFAPDPQCWRLSKKLPARNLKWEDVKQKRGEKLDFNWLIFS